MFQIIKLNEETEEDDDVINKQSTSSSSSSSSLSTTSFLTSLSESSSYSFDSIRLAPISQHGLPHSDLILSGLKSLKSNKILCDITLIAENKRFDVHKVLMASCSDYFRSMFTNGMKECQQSEIELKGVSSLGLEKVIEIIYTSTTSFDTNEALFECIAAANHMQCLLAVDLCEKNIITRVTPLNYNYFIQMSKLYRLKNALKQIDLFILNNLAEIILNMTTHKKHQSDDSLTYEQLVKCLQTNELKLKEIDLFYLTWRWFVLTQNLKSKSSLRIIRSLMKHIRFGLIEPNDLVTKVQRINKLMLADKYLRRLVLNALNHNLVPNFVSTNSKRKLNQKLNDLDDEYDSDQINSDMRCVVKSVLLIGGREISPTPNLYDRCYLLNSYFNEMNQNDSLQQITQLPTNLSHMQCVVVSDSYMYIIGGCVSQCVHGESAVSNVYRYDPRFNTWSMVKSMLEKRSYFYACAISNSTRIGSEKRKFNLDTEVIYAIGGRNKDGSLATVEKYNLKTNVWSYGAQLPYALYAHSGCVFNNTIYISGGYGGSTPHNQFTSEMYCLQPGNSEWTQLRPMNAARGWHCMSVVHDKLYVFGGCILVPSPQQPSSTNQIAHPVLATEFYSVTTNQWTLVKPMINLHKEANCIHLNNYVYVLGGYNIQTKTGQKLISRYDYTNDIWHTFMHHLPAGMTGMGCCVLELPWYLLNQTNNSTTSIFSSNDFLVNYSSDEDDEEEEDSNHYDGDYSNDDEELDKNKTVNTQNNDKNGV